MDGLTEGRIVHFVMPDGQHRPAIVVRVWRDIAEPCEGYVNLQVFTDGRNDGEQFESGISWQTSICYDDEEKKPRTWHWIEKA
jgi:hypothetical protein